MHTGDFIVYIKTDNIYKDIDEDFETKFDTSDQNAIPLKDRF